MTQEHSDGALAIAPQCIEPLGQPDTYALGERRELLFYRIG